jgi:APA family basic amino acid/polyamine antiporter
MSYARVHGSASIGWTRLAAIIWTSLASSIYFSLGIVAGHALGLTPLVYLAAGLFFALTALTYLEGATLHPERAGSTVFARYAFNELVSFVAAAAVLLDYVILIAICALTAADYLATFVPAFGHGPPQVALALAVVAYVAATNVAGFSPLRHVRRVLAGVALDVVIQLLVIVIGLVLFFHLPTITDHIHLGSVPSWTGVIYALTITTVAFMSLESASGLSGELAVGRTRRAADHLGREPDDPRHLRRHRRGRGHGGAGGRRALGARDEPPRRAGDRDRRAFPPAGAGRHAQVHGRCGRRR